jgi:short subunit dehydrogenase-like uncharacterized protein
MAKQARVVITVVGPYRYWGEPVVAACVEAGCSCLDISGEPEYIEKIEYAYSEKAKAAGCYIASAGKTLTLILYFLITSNELSFLFHSWI